MSLVTVNGEIESYSKSELGKIFPIAENPYSEQVLGVFPNDDDSLLGKTRANFLKFDESIRRGEGEVYQKILELLFLPALGWIHEKIGQDETNDEVWLSAKLM